MDSSGDKSPSDKLNPGSPANPQPFGKYLLMGLIARGGMAEVYRARSRTGGGRIYAIKCMRPQLAKEARFVEMFVNEGKLAVLLEHDCIVRTFEIGRTDGRYFIAMEYIGGRDLTQILRRCQETSSRIPVPLACFIAAKMCEGLNYAHTHVDSDGRPLAIVNRDVSPSNVRIGYDGEIKLLDFGIAQAMLKFTSEIGVLKGKFSYMSPEQIRGMPVDARTDVFSTGIILHEMLTTEKLFRGDTEFQLMERVRNAEVVPPSKFNRRVPEQLDRVVMRALARDVSDRYQSAQDLAQDLYQFLAPYRFNPNEVTDHVRQLFRADYEREVQEIGACQRALLPYAGDERDGGAVPSSMMTPEGASAQIIISGISSDGVVVPVSAHETTAPVPAETPAGDEAAVTATATGSPKVSDTIETTDTGGVRTTGEHAESSKPKSGLWARLRGRFSRSGS